MKKTDFSNILFKEKDGSVSVDWVVYLYIVFSSFVLIVLTLFGILSTYNLFNTYYLSTLTIFVILLVYLINKAIKNDKKLSLKHSKNIFINKLMLFELFRMLFFASINIIIITVLLFYYYKNVCINILSSSIIVTLIFIIVKMLDDIGKFIIIKKINKQFEILNLTEILNPIKNNKKNKFDYKKIVFTELIFATVIFLFLYLLLNKFICKYY